MWRVRRGNSEAETRDAAARRLIAAIARSAAAFAVFVLAGCIQQMGNEPKYEAYEASTLFPDGTSARPIPEGAVPRSAVVPRDSIAHDPGYTTGYEDGRPLESLPTRVRETYDLPDLLARGRERFQIYCSPCHGLTGDGDGMVPRRGFVYPPTYHSERLRRVPVGYLYGVATAGHGRMPSYAAQVPPDDRWAIVSYVRALQLSRHVPVGELPEADRRRVEEATP